MHDKGTRAGMDFSAFRARAPWWGGDLQTLRNNVLRRLGAKFDFPGARLTLDIGDDSGDRLMALFNEGEPGRPLAVLIHGLTGCESSSYMVNTARYLGGLGYPVLRLNMRGAGPSADCCGQRYHAGRGKSVV